MVVMIRSHVISGGRCSTIRSFLGDVSFGLCQLRDDCVFAESGWMGFHFGSSLSRFGLSVLYVFDLMLNID